MIQTLAFLRKVRSPAEAYHRSACTEVSMGRLFKGAIRLLPLLHCGPILRIQF